MKVLVTGGAGYIGSVAVERLLGHGDTIVVLDNAWRGHPEAVPSDVELVLADLRDGDAVKAAVARIKPEAIMHFAAVTIVPESVADPATYLAINTVGSHNLLVAALEADVSRFVFSSTAAVYGEPAVIPVREDSPKTPINPYGLSKWFVEQIMETFKSAYGMHVVSFRYFNVAGATAIRGEDHTPETHIIPVALQTLQGKRPHFSVFGTDYDTPDGTAIRDYVHVIDLVDAHLIALDRIEENLGVFNLGSRDGFSVQQIVDAVERVTGRELPVQHVARRAGDPPSLIADAGRAAEMLGWQPRHSSLDEMIGSAWEWMQRHPDGYRGASSGQITN